MIKKDEENEEAFDPIIEKLLKRAGYPSLFIIKRKFALEPPENIPDLFAFRWIGNEPETVAIECKFNKNGAECSVLDGLVQAFAYTEFCHKVYVATQKGNIGYSKEALKKLGLGHIFVDIKNETYKISLPALKTSPPRFCPDLRSRLVPLIAFKELIGKGELISRGIKGDELLELRELNKQGFIRTPGEPHFSAFTYYDDNKTISLQINLARKNQIRDFCQINKDKLLKVLRSLDPDIRISIWERESVKGVPRETKYEYILEEKKVGGITKKDIKEIIKKIKEIDYWGYIRFFKELPCEKGIPKERVLKDMRRVMKALLPLYSFLAG